MSIQKIEHGRYWNAGWQLISGCTPCSPGCEHCWSAAMTHRFGDGLTLRGDGPKNGCFDGTIITHPDRLSIPLKRRKPTVFAVWNDFYHGAVDQRFRLDAARIMDCCDRHTFLLLTKRADQAANYGQHITGKNIWHGLTVCNQEEADEKIPVFLRVPGKKFLSIEPMLSGINLGVNIFKMGNLGIDDNGVHRMSNDNIDAVILGGETGPGARPMHPDWVRSVRDQCAAAGVPFLFKGWGEFCPEQVKPVQFTPVYSGVTMDAPASMFKVGRKAAGRLLDGQTHDDLPWNQE